MASTSETFLTAVDRHKAGAFAEAEELYRRVLRDEPQYPDALHLLGVAAHQQGRHEEAVDLISRAVALNDKSATYYSNLGAANRALERFEPAEEFYRKSLTINPQYAEAHYNLGNVLLEQRKVREAIQAFAQAVRLKPEFADAQHNLAAAQRMSGHFAPGWDGYEWRFRCDIQERSLPWPVWNGSPLAGKTLLVHAEQGIGDEIMFASCLPDVARVAGRCVFECDTRLQPLFARSFPNVLVIPRRNDFRLLPEDVPFAIDFCISAGSLPRFFRREESLFPRPGIFLKADEAKALRWHERLTQLGRGTKIGISWRGGRSADVRARRSTDLALWQPILSIPDVQFINLQYDDARDEIDAVVKSLNVTIHDWNDFDRRNDLDEVAALISVLKHVISVDNSTVHLAGASGTPTWALLPFNADWRWMLDREGTPWYRIVHLSRQTKPGSWSEPIERIADCIRVTTWSVSVPLSSPDEPPHDYFGETDIWDDIGKLEADGG